MSRTIRFEGDPDVKWGIVLPPEQRRIRGMQGPAPVSAASFGNFLARGEEGLAEERQYDPSEAIVLRHLGVAVANNDFQVGELPAASGDENSGIIDAQDPQAVRKAA